MSVLLNHAQGRSGERAAEQRAVRRPDDLRQWPAEKSVNSPWQESRRKRFEAAAISTVGYRLIQLLGATLRWRTEGFEYFDAIAASGHQPIMAFWHGSILHA